MTATQAMTFRTGDTPTPDIVILTHNLAREYHMGAEVVHALRGVDIQIKKNEFVACMGPSGSGKSTLMNLIGCLDTPTSRRETSTRRRVTKSWRSSRSCTGRDRPSCW